MTLWITGILFVLGTGCVVTAFRSYQIKDMSSAAFFTAFSFLFLIPLFAITFQELSKRFFEEGRLPQRSAGLSGEPPRTRFVPHWYVMTVLILMGLGIFLRLIWEHRGLFQ